MDSVLNFGAVPDESFFKSWVFPLVGTLVWGSYTLRALSGCPTLENLWEPTTLRKWCVKSQGNVTSSLSINHLTPPLDMTSLSIGTGCHPALYTQLLASVCHSIGTHQMLCSISFPRYSLCLSLCHYLIISLSLALSPSLPCSFLSLGPLRVPCQSHMHLSRPSSPHLFQELSLIPMSESLSLPQLIPLPMAWDMIMCWTIFSSLTQITVTCTNVCHCLFLGSPRFWSWVKDSSSNGLFGR